MSKKKFSFVIIVAVVLSLFVDAMFGGYVSAKLSTVRLFGRFQLVKPAAPIVINKKEEVRANDSEDITSAVDRAKSKVSLLVYKADNALKISGGAINITSDGYFLTVKSALAAAGTNQIYVLTSDGKLYPATAGYFDPATNLVMVKTDAKGVAVADYGSAEDLVAGSRIIFLSTAVVPYGSRFIASFVSFPMNEVSGQVFDTDHPSSSFGVQGVSGIFPGQAVINLSGEVVGIFDGNTVVSSTVIKPTSSLYIEKKQSLARPTYGFKYRVIGSVESSLLNLTQGAQVIKPSANSLAAAAGLQDGDIITQVGDTKVEGNNMLELLLQKYKPGDEVIFTVARGTSNLKVIIHPGSL